jgi:hypothetical protein
MMEDVPAEPKMVYNLTDTMNHLPHKNELFIHSKDLLFASLQINP